MDYVEDIHELSLVLVNTLHEYIIHCIKSNVNALSLFNVMLELKLAISLHLSEALLEMRIRGIASDLFDHLHICNPIVLIVNCVRDKLRKAWVAAV
jgi:hypothetical protein